MRSQYEASANWAEEACVQEERQRLGGGSPGRLAGAVLPPEKAAVPSPTKESWRAVWCGCRAAAEPVDIHEKTVPRPLTAYWHLSSFHDNSCGTSLAAEAATREAGRRE